jgi:hypothetical protein
LFDTSAFCTVGVCIWWDLLDNNGNPNLRGLSYVELGGN